MAVDWSRRCYQSEWHLFADDPEATTFGRYYRCPDETPFIHGYHLYGSREWYESNWQHVQGLGESLTSPHYWNPGDRPKIIPINAHVGSLDCIENGEAIANKLPYDQIFDGFPLLCINPDLLPNGPWSKVSSYESCSLQYFYATILMWMYDHNPAQIAIAFQMLIPGCNVFWKRGTVIYPDLICVTMPTFTVLISDGTQEWQQWALQVMRGIDPPVNYGAYGTLPLWYAASTRALDFMTECGSNPTGRFMLCGHSYGGSNIYNVAARLRAWNPSRQVVCLTFGSPKPGDSRMQTLLDGTTGIAIVNDQDIVGSVPPDFPTLFPVSLLFPLAEITVWDQWEHPRDRARQAPNGALTLNTVPVLDAPTLITMLTQILTNQPFNDILTHPTEVYRKRIKTRCPDCEWPIPPALCRFLEITSDVGLDGEAADIAGGELGFTADQLHGGELGLGGEVLDEGELGLGADGELDGGELGLTPEIPEQGEVGLGEGGELDGGELGLTADQLYEGELGLGGEVLDEGELGLGNEGELDGGELGFIVTVTGTIPGGPSCALAEDTELVTPYGCTLAPGTFKWFHLLPTLHTAGTVLQVNVLGLQATNVVLMQVYFGPCGSQATVINVDASGSYFCFPTDPAGTEVYFLFANADVVPRSVSWNFL